MQSKGQTSMHTPQPLQLSGWTIAIGRSWALRTLVTLPQVSRMASSGQMTRHARQSMQSPGSIRKAFLSWPEMARVGQRFSHAVQPVQFSATMVNGTRLLLHLLQDLVGAALLDQAVVAQRLAEGDPGEEEHQDQHPRDRDVVGLEQDVEELVQRAHARSVQREGVRVNPKARAPRPLAEVGPFALRAAKSRGRRPSPKAGTRCSGGYRKTCRPTGRTSTGSSTSSTTSRGRPSSWCRSRSSSSSCSIATGTGAGQPTPTATPR